MFVTPNTMSPANKTRLTNRNLFILNPPFQASSALDITRTVPIDHNEVSNFGYSINFPDVSDTDRPLKELGEAIVMMFVLHFQQIPRELSGLFVKTIFIRPSIIQ